MRTHKGVAPKKTVKQAIVIHKAAGCGESDGGRRAHTRAYGNGSLLDGDDNRRKALGDSRT